MREAPSSLCSVCSCRWVFTIFLTVFLVSFSSFVVFRFLVFFFLNAPPPTKISPLPLHDPLPISAVPPAAGIIMAASLATPQQVVLDIGQNKKPAGSGGVTLPNSGTNDLGKQAPSQVIPTSV